MCYDTSFLNNIPQPCILLLYGLVSDIEGFTESITKFMQDTKMVCNTIKYMDINYKNIDSIINTVKTVEDSVVLLQFDVTSNSGNYINRLFHTKSQLSKYLVHVNKGYIKGLDTLN